jgi:hypothetical protein
MSLPYSRCRVLTYDFDQDLRGGLLSFGRILIRLRAAQLRQPDDGLNADGGFLVVDAFEERCSQFLVQVFAVGISDGVAIMRDKLDAL